ncbi:MAG: DUF1385 domain-containing protein [Coriobacteriales bacterium]
MPRSEKHISDIKRAEDTEGVVCQTHIGGQALLEGVMMRGRYSWAAAVRQPDGTIHTEEHDLATSQDKHGWLYWPIIRGCRALVESLVLGYKALNISTQYAYDFDEEDEEETEGAETDKIDMSEISDAEAADLALDTLTITDDSTTVEAEAAGNGSGFQAATDVEDQASRADSPVEVESKVKAEPEEDDEESAGEKGIMIVGTVLGLVLGIAAFIMLPAFLANLIVGDYNTHVIVWNIVDGVVRVGIFILYIWAISLMKDIKRMFRYHGAEHKTIHCYEHGLELTPENARQFTTLHVRCGTAFLIMTLILAIIVFSCVPVREICIGLGITDGVGQYIVIVLSRIIFIPLVAGLGYELTVKWAGSHPEKKVVKAVLWPGLQMQKLTTAEPDDGMLECAIAAMKLVLEREEREAANREVSSMEPQAFSNDEGEKGPKVAAGNTQQEGYA